MTDALRACQERLDELSKLEDGWASKNPLDGLAIPERVIERGRLFVKVLLDAGFGSFGIYPTYEGHLQFECDQDGWSWEIEISENEVELCIFSLHDEDNGITDEMKSLVDLKECLNVTEAHYVWMGNVPGIKPSERSL